MYQVFNQRDQVIYQATTLQECIDHTEELYEASQLDHRFSGISIGNTMFASSLRTYQLIKLLTSYPSFFEGRAYHVSEQGSITYICDDEHYHCIRNHIRYYIKGV